MKNYQKLAGTIQAYKNCLKTPDTHAEWIEKHLDVIKSIESNLPHGSGFDSGTTIDIDMSNESKLVFHTSFHHMDENGSYSHWSDHNVIITPSFNGIDLRITGRDFNMFKDYAYDVFDSILNEEYKELAVSC